MTMQSVQTKPIVAELRRFVGREERLVKQVPQEAIFGSERKASVSCGQVLDYMLSTKTDQFNPTPYTREEAQYAASMRLSLNLTQTDPNYLVKLCALTAGGQSVRLDLTRPLREYISEDPSSILTTKEHLGPEGVTVYQSLDLLLQDTSVGG